MNKNIKTRSSSQLIFSEIWREEEFGERRSFYTLVLVTKTSSCFCAPIWQSNSYSIKARGPIWEEEKEEEKKKKEVREGQNKERRKRRKESGGRRRGGRGGGGGGGGGG